MSHIFTRMRVASRNLALPLIPSADINAYLDFEPAAYDHWVFNKGGVGGLTGLTNGKVLTPQAPSTLQYNQNYVELAMTTGSGLLTDYVTANTRSHTFWIVAQEAAVYSAVAMLMGDFQTTPTGSGGALFLSTVSGTRYLYENYYGLVGNQRIDSVALTPTDWNFYAISMDLAGRAMLMAQNNTRKLVAQSAVEYLAGARGVVIGNGYYAGNTARLRVGEAGIIDAALSDTQLAELYARAQVRMAKQGITI